MLIVQVPITKLKPAEYNPRKITTEDFEQIKKSIEEFGFVQPIVANSADGREDVIIGGHQRFHVAKKIGMKEVPVLYVKIYDLDEEKELNIRLNKNQADWDQDKLLEFFNRDELMKWGFENWEIPRPAELEDLQENQTTPDNLIRTVVLCYKEENFKKIVDKMNAECEKLGLENYSQLIQRKLANEN